MMVRMRIPVLMLALAVALGACSRRPQPVQPQPLPLPSQPSQPTQSTPPPMTDGRSEADVTREAREARERARYALEQRIHFEFDRSDISGENERILQAKVPYLREFPQVRLVIEGHADERGSVEYNVALGMRRAAAVREFLVAFGIDRSRFELQSWGEDRPLDQRSNESAWAMNRRAEFRVSGM
jgi:peptidoglycan-associated lipoprotein